ncbi:MAG: M48 family metallopeptidase [Muribaculaceae bacterium]|nr:M48 family metallopeptidase [Muribaculaceae bacterium]
MAFTTFNDPDLGEVRVSVRANATRITGRWADGRVLIIVPRQVTAGIIFDAIARMKPSLLAHRPCSGFFMPGRDLELDGGVIFHFERSPFVDDREIRIDRSAGGATVRIGQGIDMSDPATDGMISRLLIRASLFLAPSVLLPRAAEMASALHLTPRSIDISRGHKVLGHCSRRGDIAISSICLFLPWELRDYIICHELAHLTHMDHSSRFHALCDCYLGGRERELIRSLNAYRWPVMR